MRDDNGKGFFLLVFVILPALYFVWILMPLVIFYVLPFVALSLAVGLLWERVGRGDYRILLLLLPVCYLILVWTVGFPQKVHFDPKGHQYLQSSFLYHAYQSVEAWFLFPINSIRKFFRLSAFEASREIYDLRDLSLTFWGALLIGAPAVCGHLASKNHETALQKLEVQYNEIVEEEKKKRYKEKKALWDKADLLRATIKDQEEQIAKLKAVAQFVKKDEATSSETAEADSTPGPTENLKNFLS